jgi:hypothetical protein
MPKDAIPIQIRECRLAFFAGAAAAMDLFLAIAVQEANEDAAVARLESYRLELEAFGRSLMI